jgi:signal peptidase II
MHRRLSYFLFAVLVVGLVGCDHATKHLAQSELRGHPPKTLVANVLELRYTENRDIGFSLLRRVPEPVRKPLIFTASAVGLGFLGLLWWSRRRAAWQEHAAYAVLVAGALGNLSDRLIRGYVVDFVYLHHWPVFNAADVFLVAGVALVWLASRSRQPTAALAPIPLRK